MGKPLKLKKHRVMGVGPDTNIPFDFYQQIIAMEHVVKSLRPYPYEHMREQRRRAVDIGRTFARRGKKYKVNKEQVGWN